MGSITLGSMNLTAIDDCTRLRVLSGVRKKHYQFTSICTEWPGRCFS